MTKNLWLGLIVVLALTTIIFAQSGKNQSTDKIDSTFSVMNLNSDKRVGIEFSEPMSLSETEQIIYQYGLIPEELNFEIENPYGETIYGGFTVDNNLTLEVALADFKQKHENFFQEAIQSLATDIKNEKDKSVRLGLKNLRNQFSLLYDKYKEEGLKLNSITIIESLSSRMMIEDNRFRRIEFINSSKKAEESFDLLAEINTVARESWSPNRGKSKVNKSITFQIFYFSDVSRFGSNSTYEHETQVYNNNFANYDNYYSTNLPNGYKDTQFLDSIDNFTVGTSKASLLKKDTQYYTHMALRGQSAQTANVKIKGQLGHRTPSGCYSTWCIFADATTPALISFTAPSDNQISW